MKLQIGWHGNRSEVASFTKKSNTTFKDRKITRTSLQAWGKRPAIIIELGPAHASWSTLRFATFALLIRHHLCPVCTIFASTRPSILRLCAKYPGLWMKARLIVTLFIYSFLDELTCSLTLWHFVTLCRNFCPSKELVHLPRFRKRHMVLWLSETL